MEFESLFAGLVQGAFDAGPRLLKLAALSPTQLLAQGFDRVGDPWSFIFTKSRRCSPARVVSWVCC